MGKAETVKLSGGIRVKLNDSFNLRKYPILTSQIIRAHFIKTFNSTNFP